MGRKREKAKRDSFFFNVSFSISCEFVYERNKYSCHSSQPRFPQEVSRKN